MKILAFAASSSSKSINKSLVTYAAKLAQDMSKDAEVELLDINDYEMPLFSEDREVLLGQPDEAKAFLAKIQAADALVISFAEHNGHYTVAFKNLFDWASRIEGKVYQNKPAVYLSTSPGKGGAQTVLAAAIKSAPHFGADLKASLSVPSFFDNFDTKASTISNEEIDQNLKAAIVTLL